MLTRIVIPLEVEERRALDMLAVRELRDPREQVRFILRAELERRGLLSLPSYSVEQEGEAAALAA